MYQNVILEKGLYHLTNKSFVQALEGLDPSGAVCGNTACWSGFL